jgi:hypothetical protein
LHNIRLIAGHLPASKTQTSRILPQLQLLVSLLIVTFMATAAFAQSVNMTAPVNGATVGSSVNFVATANGGSAPVGAIWIYVDNQPVYQTTNSSINTYVTLAPGSHHVVPVAWNTLGQVATQSLYITVNGSASGGAVTITAPAAGATVSSPVNFVASASAPFGRQINAMRIYVDSNNDYTVGASSLNTSLALAPGLHNINMQAWDNTGAVYIQTMTITVGSSGGSGGGSQYQNDFNATSSYVSQFSQSDGAILYTPQEIDPYFSNIAAIGMTKDPNRMPQVVAWMNWYVNHLNWPDQWGLYGTTYNYSVNNGVETSMQQADSTDSYAATFLTLVWNAWLSGDQNARSFIAGLSYQLDVIGGVLIQTQQSDGLTWAKPDYQIKYLMDNCEAYRGLRDLASIYQNAFGDTTKAAYYNAAADAMQNGILSMWMNGTWAVYRNWYGNNIAPNMGAWYADATAQVFPVLMGVVTSSDSRAQQAYAAFNAAWPGWPTLSFNSQDPFPWVLVADGAAAMGDNARVATYINSIQNKYVNSGFPWPFYNAEAGWFMRANNYMMGNGL